MATSAIAGYKGKALVSESTSGSVSSVAEVRNWNLSVEHAEIDATSHDSSGDREVIGGLGSWSGSAEFLHVQGSTDHQALMDALLARSKVLFEFYPTGSSSDGYYDGEGYMTGYELGAPNEDAATGNVSMVGSGVLTRNSSST